ncbi:hypothetical protein B9Z55_024301 [Caenorhabditis nigoni]|uniref:Uncharacterized protein n=1 Tax=Caenorhabditis nigoni TaxID=1611254 RepID=A0A2G5STU5_9PELO|nr:hypothetical protein B9Z55_024301 [Caenorhabditis nigoni]
MCSVVGLFHTEHTEVLFVALHSSNIHSTNPRTHSHTHTYTGKRKSLSFSLSRSAHSLRYTNASLTDGWTGRRTELTPTGPSVGHSEKMGRKMDTKRPRMNRKRRVGLVE